MPNIIENILKDIDKAIRELQVKLEAGQGLDEKLPYAKARTDLEKARAIIRPHFYTTENEEEQRLDQSIKILNAKIRRM